MNGLALCSGVGGLELGIGLALGRGQYRTVCHVEREAYAAAVLVARMADGHLDQAPVWDDLTTFDGEVWRGVVDIITAGFPCQPFSTAGKQLGLEDDRWLWPDIARIIGGVRPGYVFLENVPGFVVHGLEHVLGSLARLGFNAEWGSFSAEEAGAPHRRKRFFLLAHSDSVREPQQEGGEPEEWGRLGNCRSDVANPLGSRRKRVWGGPERSGPQQSVATHNGWWGTEPGMGRVADGVPNRVDRLRALGNGVVPAVAARAFTALKERLGTS